MYGYYEVKGYKFGNIRYIKRFKKSNVKIKHHVIKYNT